MVDRQEPNPNQSLIPITVPGIHELYLNTKEFPDAAKQLSDAVLFGMYKAWQTASSDRVNITWDEYQAKLAAGADLSFSIMGLHGDQYVNVSPITVDPRKSVEFVFVAAPGNQLQPWPENSGASFRDVNGQLFIEVYDWTGGGQANYDKEYNPDSPLFEASGLLALGLGFMAQASVQTSGTLDAGDVDSAVIKEIETKTVPYMNGDHYHGLVLAR